MLLSPTLERKQPEDRDSVPFVLTRARRMPYDSLNKYSNETYILFSVVRKKWIRTQDVTAQESVALIFANFVASLGKISA